MCHGLKHAHGVATLVPPPRSVHLYKHREPPAGSTDTLSWQVSTTKGTGGDVIILEEAAYVNPGFFYETVAPLLSIGSVCVRVCAYLLAAPAGFR